MAKTLQGKLLVIVNENASDRVVKGCMTLAEGAMKKKGVEADKIAQILKTVKVIKLGNMVKEVERGGKIYEYPTSPFELVIEHDQCQAFSTKGDKPSLRFRTNLTELGVAKAVEVDGHSYDRYAYAHSRRVECFNGDKKGIERLMGLANVAEKLYAWKQHIKTALAELDLEPKDVSRYDLKKTLEDDYVGMTPYCVTLPEANSAIVVFVVAVEGKQGTYFKQEFCWHYNVGLTHTGGSNDNPDSQVDKESLDKFYSLMEDETSEDPDSEDALW